MLVRSSSRGSIRHFRSLLSHARCQYLYDELISGVPLIDGGTIRLPRLIGISRAMDIILTGYVLQNTLTLVGMCWRKSVWT